MVMRHMRGEGLEEDQRRFNSVRFCQYKNYTADCNHCSGCALDVHIRQTKNTTPKKRGIARGMENKSRLPVCPNANVNACPPCRVHAVCFIMGIVVNATGMH